MSWWQNWQHAFAHPADNVVAAMVVLIGVAVTAIVTLTVAAANRRHERNRQARERLFQPRADAYVQARTWLRDDMVAAMQNEHHRPATTPDEYRDLTSRLAIFGENDGVEAFNDAMDKNRQYFIMRTEKAKEEDLEACFAEMRNAAAKFDVIARKNVQRLRESRTLPPIHRW